VAAACCELAEPQDYYTTQPPICVLTVLHADIADNLMSKLRLMSVRSLTDQPLITLHKRCNSCINAEADA